MERNTTPGTATPRALTYAVLLACATLGIGREVNVDLLAQILLNGEGQLTGDKDPVKLLRELGYGRVEEFESKWAAWETARDRWVWGLGIVRKNREVAGSATTPRQQMSVAHLALVSQLFTDM